MSEVVRQGRATGFMTSCVQLVSSKARAAHEAFNDAVERSIQTGRDEYDRLVEYARQMPEEAVMTVAEARQEILNKVGRFKTVMPGKRIAAGQRQAMLSLAALRHSTLGKFVMASDWKKLTGAKLSQARIKKLIDRAAARCLLANHRYVLKSIEDVARAEGFTNKMRLKTVDGKAYMTMVADDGKALVTKAIASEQGIAVDMDLSGFNGNGCHAKMEQLLRRLHDRGITLQGATRHSLAPKQTCAAQKTTEDATKNGRREMRRRRELTNRTRKVRGA